MKPQNLMISSVLVISNISAAMACTEMQVSPANPVTRSEITLTCKTDVEVKQIAMEIAGEAWNASFPYLYDDGSHGDQTQGDTIYSLTTVAPTAPGSYKLKFYRVLPDQSELESEITFTVE